VRHVTAVRDRSQARSLRLWLSAALVVPAVVMLLRAQPGTGRTELARAKGAEATGLVQAVRAKLMAAASAAPAPVRSAVAGKEAAGKSSGGVKTAASTHMLQETAAPAQKAAPAEPAVKGADQNPDKILLKMYMEVQDLTALARPVFCMFGFSIRWLLERHAFRETLRCTLRRVNVRPVASSQPRT
jgi:hypothetical protein